MELKFCRKLFYIKNTIKIFTRIWYCINIEVGFLNDNVFKNVFFSNVDFAFN